MSNHSPLPVSEIWEFFKVAPENAGGFHHRFRHSVTWRFIGRRENRRNRGLFSGYARGA
jgi:hypothetical protein